MIDVQREVAPGIKLEAILSGPYGSGASIAIPVNVVEASTDAELARLIRSMVPDAHYAEALNIADCLTGNGSSGLSWILTEPADNILKLEQHAGYYPTIDRALAMLAEARARKKHKEAAPQKRREIQSDYTRFFVTLGRRDGFYCASCKQASKDLQIDHVVAVINGGNNDLDNLQLLCATCNSQKSDKVNVP